MTAIGATAVVVTVVRNDLKLWKIINIGSNIILYWSLLHLKGFPLYIVNLPAMILVRLLPTKPGQFHHEKLETVHRFTQDQWDTHDDRSSCRLTLPQRWFLGHTLIQMKVIPHKSHPTNVWYVENGFLEKST